MTGGWRLAADLAQVSAEWRLQSLRKGAWGFWTTREGGGHAHLHKFHARRQLQRRRTVCGVFLLVSFISLVFTMVSVLIEEVGDSGLPSRMC